MLATPPKKRARSGSLLSTRSRPPNTPMSRGSNTDNADDDSFLAVGDRPHAPRRSRATSSSGVAIGNSKTPGRSFYHRSFHGQLDPAQYSSLGVRDQTAELASLALSDASFFDSSPRSAHANEDENDSSVNPPDAIEEVSEPVTPEFSPEDPPTVPQVSALTEMIRKSPPSPPHQGEPGFSERGSATLSKPSFVLEDDIPDDTLGDTEETALLPKGPRRASTPSERNAEDDVESQGLKTFYGRQSIPQKWRTFTRKGRHYGYILSHPKTWNPRMIWQEAVLHPARLIPAVFLGLLLNILDALSYGMILFPLGQPIFEDLGSDGIAMFYVSTIVAQVVYSSGGSVFRGGIGSEMIEVVPFFHKMAFTILNKVGEDNPKSVLATTILSFAISSVLTGAVFFIMGACGLGSLIGFFPRHILIGCIGGVGWFLVATGLEVSARLPGNLEYNLETVKQLFRSDTIFLWTIPLVLAIVLLVTQRFVKSNFLVGGYFISVAMVFYFFKFALDIHIETLHSKGWVFDSPPAGNPWWHFYTLYDFRAVNWQALADTIPAMFALTFFGVLHVPINVPALGISTGEDNLNVDRELLAHGVSNCLSGCIGSIQNYLVYTNSLLFIDSGGNDRLAGMLLALATGGILLAGPTIVGYIPIMVVGALIFLLGIELLQEALVDTYGRLHRLEYATVLIIVVTMGVWDFVLGIVVGIILAALNFVVQTSRRTAIRATYSGQVAKSTVRRPPVQLHFLKEAGQQIFVIKLAGFLFFGTIVSVEKRIRALLDEDAFSFRPLRYLVLDMTHINGVDFSAAEAFTRINRLLKQKGVQMLVSGLKFHDEIGQGLQNVGLFEEENEVRIFADLNEALESCENELLATLYRQQEHLRTKRVSSHLDVPIGSRGSSSSYPSEHIFNSPSPRRHHLQQAAVTTLNEDLSQSGRWQSFKQPLPLLLQAFEDVSDGNEDFWFRAVPFFERFTYPQGSVLYNKGDESKGFYLLEEGILRADYDLPQGKYSELIVQGRPCGELPFFSETRRTATTAAEKDCVVWRLSGARWKEMQAKESDLAQELLKVSLKLTTERMEAITSYVLTTAG